MPIFYIAPKILFPLILGASRAPSGARLMPNKGTDSD